MPDDLHYSKGSNKDCLVGLSETFSNNYKIIRDYVKNHASTPVNTDIDPAITDQSYNPDYIVKSIKQQQKTLTEYEIQSIIQKYQNGASSYDLAKEFGCHRRTITDTLKRNGVEVSHQAATKPELVKRIIELYAEMKTPKEVGAIAGINEGISVVQEHLYRLPRNHYLRIGAEQASDDTYGT